MHFAQSISLQKMTAIQLRSSPRLPAPEKRAHGRSLCRRISAAMTPRGGDQRGGPDAAVSSAEAAPLQNIDVQAAA